MRRDTVRHDDSGASLIFALIVVTVISVTVAVLLTFVDSSLRATIALRAQAYETASADGAAQIAINTLRNGTYDSTVGQCFTAGLGTTNTLTLTNFYLPPTGPADSAAVTCEPDATRSATSTVAIGPPNKPRNAILSLSTAAGEDGVHIDVADGRDLKVHGDIFANSTVTVPRGSLTTDAALTARGACTGTITAVPAKVCAIGAVADPRGVDPNYPAPTAAAPLQAVPSCVGVDKLVTFTPGLYTDITGLNNLTRCRNTTFFFPPGVYYFSFPDTIPWLVDSNYIVAGTPTTALVAGTPPTIPGSCLSPFPPKPLPVGWTPPAANAGTQFVFGSGARMILRATQAEFCGSYSTTEAPIALYGLKTAVGSVPAQNGCVTTTPYPLSGCAVITAENQPTSKLYVQGTTYLPSAALDVALNNPGGLAFSVGVIVRSLYLTPTGTASLVNPVIEVPDDVPFGRRTVVYLNVYLCPGSNTCSVATGRVRLRAKVGLLDPTGTPVAGARQITVYSWSVQR